MVVTDLRISFPFAKTDDGCILELLWDSFLPPHSDKELSFSAIRNPPDLYISVGMAFVLGALPKDRFALFVSVTVWNSSSRTLHSICGSLLIALSLVVDRLLSTLLKCSAYLTAHAITYIHT